MALQTYRFRVELVDVYLVEVDAESEAEARARIPGRDDLELELDQADVFAAEQLMAVTLDDAGGPGDD